MTATYYSSVQDVATVDSGPAFKSSQFGEVGEGIPLLRGENIEPGALRWSKTRTWPESLLPGYEHLLVEKGDLILGMDRPVISTGLKLATVTTPDVPALLVQRVARIRPRSIDGRYLYLWLSSNEFIQHLQRSATGTQLPHVNLASVRRFRVPRFGEDAERRIVDLLEDHLSRLDAAEAQLGAVLRRIDSLRVASMRRALNAQPDWKVAPINDWLDTSIGGLWGSAPGVAEVDVRVIRVTEMKAWGRIAPATAAVRSITRRQLAGRALEEGDLLLEKSGGGPKTPVGRVGLVESLAEPSICANFMQLMRPDRSRVNPRFLHYALNAFHLSGETAPMQTASTNIRNIKASEYLQVKLAVPHLRQQDILVERIAFEHDAADRLAHAVVAARNYNAGLRRSLLTAAFSGRLTASRSEQEMITT